MKSQLRHSHLIENNFFLPRNEHVMYFLPLCLYVVYKITLSNLCTILFICKAFLIFFFFNLEQIITSHPIGVHQKHPPFFINRNVDVLKFIAATIHC